MRQLVSPHGGQTVTGTVNVDTGGLGFVSSPVIALNAVGLSAINSTYGIAGLDEAGKILPSVIPDEGVMQIGIKGPTAIFTNQTVTYQITNYDMFTTYTLEALSGSVSIAYDTITYKAPSSVQDAGFYINGRLISIVVNPAV